MLRPSGLGVLVLALGVARASLASPILDGSLVDARLCADPACDTVTMTLETERPAPGSVTGTLAIDPVALRIAFDLVLESAVLSGEDGIWTRLELHDVKFHGTGTLDRLPIRAGKGGWSITGGAAEVDGTVVMHSPRIFRLVDPSVAFSTTPTLGGLCRQLIDTSCAITFGLGDFSIPFLDGPRLLALTLNATVPEPTTAALLAVGLTLVGCARWLRA